MLIIIKELTFLLSVSLYLLHFLSLSFSDLKINPFLGKIQTFFLQHYTTLGKNQLNFLVKWHSKERWNVGKKERPLVCRKLTKYCSKIGTNVFHGFYLENREPTKCSTSLNENSKVTEWWMYFVRWCFHSKATGISSLPSPTIVTFF